MSRKSLDELNLSTAPIHSDPKPVDDRTTEWYQFSQEIESLLLEVGEWAKDTLLGIQASVEERKIVTEGQRSAVRNIRRGNERSRQSRRYEGFGTSRARKGW